MLIGLGVKGLKPNWKRLGSCTSGFVWGKGREGVVWFIECGAPSNDRANGGSVSVDVF